MSLDLESYYGISSGYDYSKKNINYYGKLFIVVPRILELFEKYRISCTWATVGLLGVESEEEGKYFFPESRPTAEYQFLNNYKRFYDNIGNREFSKWLSCPQIIRKIVKSERQETGSHTFSHIFCNETGITSDIILSDTKAQRKIFKEKFGVDLTSLVFPHDQIPQRDIVDQMDFHQVRYPFDNNAYDSSSLNRFKKWDKKTIRFLDIYIN